ncbi:MAG TPA: PA2928 family protein [Flavisolibacter sp.]|nr:PA2928 family protein [Flavisolibacter sp.]
MRKIFLGGFLLIGLFIAAFLFLLKGCLSQYDERYSLSSLLYFERGDSAVVFSIVGFEETTSYSRSGGITRKSMKTSYHVQSNDARSGRKLSAKRIKDHSDISHHPVETLGSAHQRAWLFAGELMAFDPFSLRLLADKEKLVELNPGLRHILPDERRFYYFNEADGHIYFTASDGSAWQLNTLSLKATPSTFEPGSSSYKTALDQLSRLQQKNREAQDSLFRQYTKSKVLSAGGTKAVELRRIQTAFAQQRDALYRTRDSLQALQSSLRRLESEESQLRNTIRNLRGTAPGFSQMKINQDTLGGKWYGLYAHTEMERLPVRLQFQASYDETARRQLHIANLDLLRDGEPGIDKDGALPAAGYFLQGGFLLNKKTARPIRLAGKGGWLVVFKDRIGNEGRIVLARLDLSGKTVWQLETGLKDWADWICTPERLMITGTDNPKLSSSQSNLLLIVDLSNGRPTRYDFFDDK